MRLKNGICLPVCFSGGLLPCFSVSGPPSSVSANPGVLRMCASGVITLLHPALTYSLTGRLLKAKAGKIYSVIGDIVIGLLIALALVGMSIWAIGSLALLLVLTVLYMGLPSPLARKLAKNFSAGNVFSCAWRTKNRRLARFCLSTRLPLSRSCKTSADRSSAQRLQTLPAKSAAHGDRRSGTC